MPWESEYQKATSRLHIAKERMDDLQAELDRAEDEYHQACKALDDLEDQPFLSSVPSR